MQQIKQPTATQSLAQTLAPNKKATNKAVVPVSKTPTVPGYDNGTPVQQPGFGMPPRTEQPKTYDAGTTPDRNPNVPGYNNNIPVQDKDKNLQYGGGTRTDGSGNTTKPTTGANDPKTQNPYTPTVTPGQPATPGGGNINNNNDNNQGLMYASQQGTYQDAVYNSVTGNAAQPRSNYQDATYNSVTGNAAQPKSNYQDAVYNSVAGNAAQPKSNYQDAVYNSVAGNAPQIESNTPQTEFSANDYESNGYDGVQGNTEYNYDPRSESLVQNQITGLLDPNSDLMRKAISQANGYSASRGLQSSSLGSEVALSTMIDKAMPIAQQDAGTYANADQTGWQQSFTADQNNLSRTHDASMFDKQGELQTNLQNDQLNFTNTQNNADRTQQTELQQLQYKQNLGLLDAEGEQRLQELNTQQGFQAEMQDLQYQQNLGQLDAEGAQRLQELNAQQGFQAEMQDLQYQQSLGTLDAEGRQRLQELNAQQGFQMDMQNLTYNQNMGTMEKQAQLQERRDSLLNDFETMKLDKTYLQDLEKTSLTWQHDDDVFARNLNGQFALEYKNASADAYNNYLEQVGLVFNNPSMTAEQQNAGVAYLKTMFESQRQQMQVIYGVTGGTQVTDAYNPPNTPNTQLQIPYNPGNPQQPVIPSTGGSTANTTPSTNTNNNGGANGRITGGIPGGGIPGGSIGGSSSGGYNGSIRSLMR